MVEECGICYSTKSSKSFSQCFRCLQKCCLTCYERLNKCAFCRKKLPDTESEYEGLIEMSLHELKDMAKLKSQLIMFIKNNFEFRKKNDQYYYYY